MLIESCVAAPATPNGKPAMPGSESASAFYHPNRQQQMQSRMQRQPSLESQYSSMQQQFVPSQSHQIEDIVAVSTPNVEKPKPEKTLPLGKQSSIEAIAWVQPFEGSTAAKGAVSALIRERATSKVTVVNENGSHEGRLPEKCEEGVDTLVSLSQDSEISKGEQAPGNKEQSDAPWDESQSILQGESTLLDENSQLLNSTEEQAPQTEESNVFGFFRKIQSFLFSPKQKRRFEEPESSCCESDFDSEFSEMTQGSFNPGDIEAIRDELETLLSGPPTPGLERGDEFFYGGSSSSQQRISLPLEQEAGAIDSGDKCMLEMEEIKVETKVEKNAEESNDNGNLRGEVADAHGSDKTTADNKQSETTEIKKGVNSNVEDVVGGTQELASYKGAECHINSSTGEVDNSSQDASNGEQENNRDLDDNGSPVYRTTSVVKIQKETTV